MKIKSDKSTSACISRTFKVDRIVYVALHFTRTLKLRRVCVSACDSQQLLHWTLKWRIFNGTCTRTRRSAPVPVVLVRHVWHNSCPRTLFDLVLLFFISFSYLSFLHLFFFSYFFSSFVYNCNFHRTAICTSIVKFRPAQVVCWLCEVLLRIIKSH